MKRTFIAIKIYPDSGFKEFLKDLQTKLKDEKIRWIDLHNMHLTLRFLGEIREELLPIISKELMKVALTTFGFKISLRGLGVFRSVSYPRVLWAGIDKHESLENLKREIDKKLLRIGFAEERKAFSPHLTLGRMKRIDNRDNIRNLIQKSADISIQEQEAESMIFYESNLTAKGPEYIPIKEYFFI